MYADQRRLEYPRYIETRNIHNLFCSNLDLYEENQKKGLEDGGSAIYSARNGHMSS